MSEVVVLVRVGGSRKMFVGKIGDASGGGGEDLMKVVEFARAVLEKIHRRTFPRELII